MSVASFTLKLVRNSEFGFLRNIKCHRRAESRRRRWKSTYFVTTPIFYVNANPHVGHLYTTLLADAIARFEKMKNPDVELKFMTGTDEHGFKVALAAQDKKMDEQSYCDFVSGKYRELFEDYNICHTDYLRTTEDRHKNTVTQFWNKISENGHIYLAEYSGWYCVSDEVFVSETDLEPEANAEGIRLTKDDKKATQFVKEMNYKFKLSSFKSDLLHWLQKGPVVHPEKFQKILEALIRDERCTEDLSISRPANRMKWGIPVPKDPSQNIYVWLDALSSYITSSGGLDSMFRWPPDVQVIGKDILKFHGVYWPAFLMAAGLDPPKCIFCHSHWLTEGEKMSKSKGNIIDPRLKLEQYTSEGFRYFLLTEGVAHRDGHYHESEVLHVINAGLADKLGNLLMRCTSKIVNPRQIFPGYSAENHRRHCGESASDLIRSLETLPEQVREHFESFDFYKGAHAVVDAISVANKFFENEKPWELAKDAKRAGHLRSVMHITMETLRVSGILLQPIVPRIADNLLNKLSVSPGERNFRSIRPFSWDGDRDTNDADLSSVASPLFPRIRVAKN